MKKQAVYHFKNHMVLERILVILECLQVIENWQWIFQRENRVFGKPFGSGVLERDC
jgi:hypothetical protein